MSSTSNPKEHATHFGENSNIQNTASKLISFQFLIKASDNSDMT